MSEIDRDILVIRVDPETGAETGGLLVVEGTFYEKDGIYIRVREVNTQGDEPVLGDQIRVPLNEPLKVLGKYRI